MVVDWSEPPVKPRVESVVKKIRQWCNYSTERLYHAQHITTQADRIFK